ncbi:class I SAM-dependent methyltransferase [Alicyclobacillus sp. ALC3]|uniref:class I SAM-dependent methyltransferase n=1 Tax=Alicyclobacillus sp. ALC3 TaxID=2796143 RepID=UPI002378AEBD|nr:class I SAM-dependent methyltransferase [Alicyclobacillus sp. ALC3]
MTAYNRQAAERNASSRQDWKVSERDAFLASIRSSGLTRLLEIGAGPGHDSLFFQENGLDVTSVDLSPNMVDLCKTKGLRAEVMDFSHLSFPDDSFDAVWALNCLLHVRKAELPEVLTELRRVLRPGGLFYMGVYGGQNSEGVWDDDTYEPKRFFSFFEMDTLKGILSEHFAVQDAHALPHSSDLMFLSFTLQVQS